MAIEPPVGRMQLKRKGARSARKGAGDGVIFAASTRDCGNSVDLCARLRTIIEAARGQAKIGDINHGLIDSLQQEHERIIGRRSSLRDDEGMRCERSLRVSPLKDMGRVAGLSLVNDGWKAGDNGLSFRR